MTIFWPALIAGSKEPVIFKLKFTDAGESCMSRFNHILPVSCLLLYHQLLHLSLPAFLPPSPSLPPSLPTRLPSLLPSFECHIYNCLKLLLLFCNYFVCSCFTFCLRFVQHRLYLLSNLRGWCKLQSIGTRTARYL